MEQEERKYLADKFVEGTLTVEEAYRLQDAVGEIAGCYPVASLCVADVLERAHMKWEPDPILGELAMEATYAVYEEVSGSGDLSFEYDRALELIEEDAVARRITLTEKEDEDADAN